MSLQLLEDISLEIFILLYANGSYVGIYSLSYDYVSLKT